MTTPIECDLQFRDYFCNIELKEYGNRRLAIELVNAKEDLDKDLFIGMPIARATVNVPEINIDDSQVIIKSHSENEGMVQAMEKFGYINDPKPINIGYVNVYVANKTEKLLALEEQKNSKAKKMKM